MPRDVVRDLLGVARALYATRKAEGAGSEELAKLEGAGKELVAALELSKTEPDTNGHRAAWSKANRGTAALLEVLVSCDDSLAKPVLAWAARLKATG
ncbi:MAG: hypothetical protein WDO74_10920 [Pseudomonadota bacterium]